VTNKNVREETCHKLLGVHMLLKLG